MSTVHTVKERPILFSGPMVRAILDGSKTQTRRVVKPQPQWVDGKRDLHVKGSEYTAHSPEYNHDYDEWVFTGETAKCPYGQTGERLWVREKWAEAYNWTSDIDEECPLYAVSDDKRPLGNVRWRPSIHMPRWASRITLEITSVRVERLQDISEDDAMAEGIDTEGEAYNKAEHFLSGGSDVCGKNPAVFVYACLWESINGPGSWDANPWVWVIEFKRVL